MSSRALDHWHALCQSLDMEMTPKQHLAETLWRAAVPVTQPSLDVFCREQLAAGMSYRDLADEVAKHMPPTIEVSRESLRRWYGRVPA